MDSLASKEEIENKRRTWLDCIEKVNTDVTSQMRGALAEVADDTLYLVDGAVFAPVSQERSLDPLASITWEDVIEVLTLALHMRSNNWLPTPWVILAIIVLGFNESMLLLKNHLYLMALFIIFLLPKAGWTQLDIAGEFRLGATVAATAIPDGWMGLDDSIKTFSDALDTTETVIWNGPMGVFEFIKFATGTMAISKKLVDLSGKGVTTIIGGGDSVAAVEQAGLGDKMSHISTGGGGVMLNVNTSPQAQFFAPDAACLPPVLNFARNS